MKKTYLSYLVTLVILMPALLPAASKIDFSKQLMPLFEERCIKCHGRKKESGKIVTKGDLDLTKPESIKETFKAGHPGASSLYQLVISDDEDEYMPPKGDRLTAEQKKLISDWISQGGDFGRYKPAAASSGPQVAPAKAGDLQFFANQGALIFPLSMNSSFLQLTFRPVATKIGDEAISELPRLKEQLVWLNLSRTQVTDEGIAVLGQLSKLTRLYLDNTAISDKGLQHISKLPNLEYLNLHKTQITDEGLKILANLKNLKKLYLWQTQVTPAGVAALRQALPKTYVNFPETKPKPAPSKARKKKKQPRK